MQRWEEEMLGKPEGVWKGQGMEGGSLLWVEAAEATEPQKGGQEVWTVRGSMVRKGHRDG